MLASLIFLVIVFLCEFSLAYQTIWCQERKNQLILTARRQLDSEVYSDFVSSYSLSVSHGKKISKAVFASVAAVVTSSVWPNRQALAAVTPTRPLLSDEVEIEITQQFLGIGLQESKYGDEYRVLVQSVKPDAEAVTKEKIREGMVFVSVDGRNVEGLSRAEIADVIKAASRPLKLVFRDPTAFFMQLNSSLPESDIFTDVRTVVKSAKVGDDGNIDAEEVLRVEKVELAKNDKGSRRSAKVGDVIELSYQVFLEDGKQIDGVQTLAPAGSAITNDSLFVILGSSTPPDGPFPQAWDLGIRGMCVGERRRITLPPSLSYGTVGNRNYNIPPKASLVYDVRLLSIDGYTSFE